MKFCHKCRDFFEDENTKCPKCGEPLGRPIRLAPKPGTPIVPRILDMMSDEDKEDLKRSLLQHSESEVEE